MSTIKRGVNLNTGVAAVESPPPEDKLCGDSKGLEWKKVLNGL